ncbi:MAG: hypothetical protein ACREJ3_09410 [Polyangiaceae bacterium]
MRRRLWPFAVLPALSWAISFAAARTIHTVATYDTAYYYVIARNVAQGRGLTDTVLWQFLGVPESVQRPAGGYWEIGWPIILGTLMRLFGHSQRASIFICSALSGLVPLATALVAYLAAKRLDVAWLAGFLVCLQVRLLATNITPDATTMYQLAYLSGMVALLWVQKRDASPGQMLAIGVVLAFPMHVRGEGFILGAAALPLLFFSGGRPSRAATRRTFWVAAGMMGFVLAFVLRDLVVFGHLVPKSRSLRLWMTRYDDLYRFASDPSPATFWAQGAVRIANVRVDALRSHLDGLMHEVPWPLVAFSVAGVAAMVRSSRTWVLPLFFCLSLLVPCLVVPIIASVDRFAMNVLPVLCVAASFGIFAVRDAVARSTAPRFLRFAVLSAATLACIAVFRDPISFRTYIDRLRIYRHTPDFLANTRSLAPLHLLPTDVVLTDEPWRVAAVLDVATVMCPVDGPAAVDAVVKKYRPRFVIAKSNSSLQRLVAAKKFDLRAVATMKDATWYVR